jgi:hypothetical protein
MDSKWLMGKIQEHIQQIIEEEAEKAAKEAYSRVKKDAGNIAVRLLENFSCYSEDRRLIIEVKKDV